MADFADLAEETEAQLRADALAAHRRRQAEAASRAPVTECEDCGGDIPPERQKAMRGTTRCCACQGRFELIHKGYAR